MMLFVYVPERNIYFVSTEEGTTYAYQRAFKEENHFLYREPISGTREKLDFYGI